MLAIATVLGVKLFRLKSRPSDEGESLKVSKIEVSSSLGDSGAKIVEFSPDGKWLLLVRNDSHLVVARLIGTGRTIQALSTTSKLERIDRGIEKSVSLGGLGSYDRNINRVAFSSNSRILAVSDLAGFIDTFVLEGEEEVSTNGQHDHISISSDDDSSEDEREEKQTKVLFGQHWEQNPAGNLIPQLPSPPTVLSFRPSADTNNESTEVHVHATRNNPHPVSHHSSSGEDRLMVVTAGAIGNYSKVLEFNVLQGTLSEWSKRNPIARFPEEYRGLRDQAMGCVWDIKAGQERMWLYGTSWLWMFDLSRDLPLPTASSAITNGHSSEVEAAEEKSVSKKRRRTKDLEAKEMRKGASGAGNKVPDHENTSGISRKMQRFLVDETNEERQIRREDDAMEVDSDDEEDEDDDMVINGLNGEESMSNGDSQTSSSHWCTYKYRPILGIVGLGEGEAEFEIAIVERPLWEADLPARYYGDQEWQQRGVDL